jgi:hypothetical protein
VPTTGSRFDSLGKLRAAPSETCLSPTEEAYLAVVAQKALAKCG